MSNENHDHDHGHGHHGHVHSTHPAIIKRLKRANGHLAKIVKMIEEERPCLEVAQQMQAVYKAIESAKSTFIHDHIQGCLSAEGLSDKDKLEKNINDFKEITKYL